MKVVWVNVECYGILMFYVNYSGVQIEIFFDGGFMVVFFDGKIFDELFYFEEVLWVYDLDEVIKGGWEQLQFCEKMFFIYDVLVMGICDYFKKLGFKWVILGFFGGIDLVLVAVFVVWVLGVKNVCLVLMFLQFFFDYLVVDVWKLVENLGVFYDIIFIELIYNSFMEVFKFYFWAIEFNIVEENMQFCFWGNLFMALFNKFGNIFFNIFNKSEVVVGYGIFYGDMCGGLFVIGDFYKIEVFEFCCYINWEEEVIFDNIIIKFFFVEFKFD